MHDLSALEANDEYEQDEYEQMEMEMEGEDEEPELEEAQELEAAAQLLSVGNEAELEDFIGTLIGRAASALNKHVKAKTGNSLGSLLKGFARQALPMVATAIGGPVGGWAARGGLDAAMKAFGLELEGLSEEDRELEIARRFVRVANATSRRAMRQPVMRDPRAQARSALRWAMRRYAPGFLRNRFGPNYRHWNRYWRRRPFGYRGRYFDGYGQPADWSPGYPGGALPDHQGGAGLQEGGMPGQQGGAMQGGAMQGGGMPGEGTQQSCPPCPTCPVCPECGAPHAEPPPQASPPPGGNQPHGGGQTPDAKPDAGVKTEFELAMEEEGDLEDEYEQDETVGQPYGYYGARGAETGRWVRRGNRIVLFGA